VGDNYGIVQLTYSTGAVTGSGASNQIGGLVGYNEGTVQTSYSTGSVTGGSGSSEIGGLVGYNDVPATVQTSYSTGAVSGVSGFVGGLIGENNGTVSYSFWDTTTSGQSTSAGGTSETTAQMLQQLTFVPVGTGASNWDLRLEQACGDQWLCERWPRQRGPDQRRPALFSVAVSDCSSEGR